MATDREALLLQISTDLRSLEKSFNKANGVVDTESRRMERRAEGAARSIEKSFGDIRLPPQLARELNQFGVGIGAGLARMSRGAQLALGAISAYAIKLAADAAEIESAFDVAFKGSAKSAREFSNVLADNVGRDAVQAREAMTRLQLVLTGTGVAAAQAAEMTKRLTEIGIDAGSLFNTSDAEAFQKIISGLTGEAEPLKAFGVVINETAVKQELLRLGFKGTASEASESAKSIARANLIMKGLAVAQGDAARTAGSAANQTRALQAEFNKAARELGEQLLPAFIKAAHGATDLLKAFNDLPSGVQLAGLAFVALVAGAGPIGKLIGGLLKVIDLANKTRLALAGVAAAELATGGAGLVGGVAAGATAGATTRAGVAAAMRAPGPIATALGAAGNVAGAAVGAVAAPLATAGVGAALIYTGARYQKTVKQAKEATDAAIDGAMTSARAQIEAASKGGPAGQQVVARLSKDLATLTAEKTRRAALKPGAKPAAPPAAPTEFTLTEEQKTGVGKPKKPKAPKAPPRDTSDEEAARIAAQIAGADHDVLQARLDLAVNAEDRANLEKKILEADTEEADARLRGQIAAINDPKNTGLDAEQKKAATAQLEGLRVQNQAVANLKAVGIDRERDARLVQEQLAADQAALDAQIEAVQNADSLATTASEHRRNQLELLDLSDRRLIAELDATIATEGIAESVKEEARRRKKALEDSRAGRAAVVRDQTAGPAEQFINANSTKQAAERFEAITVGALDNLSDGLAQAIAYADNLGDVAKNVFRQMIADLLATSLKTGIVAPLLKAAGSFLFPGAPVAAAEGGLVRGPGTSTSDSIAAWLSNKEFVVNAKATAKHLPMLEAINRGQMPRFAEGGMVTASPAMLALNRAQLPTRSGAAVSVAQSFDLRGAVVTEELYARMQAIGQQSAAAAVSRSARLADRQFPGRSATLQILGT